MFTFVNGGNNGLTPADKYDYLMLDIPTQKLFDEVIMLKLILSIPAFVVLGFFACWCPFHAQRLASTYLREYSFFDELNYWMYISSGIFYYFSSTLNPILYNVMSERMRNAFREVICGAKVKRRSTINRHTMKETSEVLISNNVNNSNESDELRRSFRDDAILVYAQKSKSTLFRKLSDRIPYSSNETTI